MTWHVIATAPAHVDADPMDQTSDQGEGVTTGHGAGATDEQVGRVRAVLRANAAVTGGCGAVMLAAGGWLADVAEVERVWVTGIGVFFLVLALVVAVLAARPARTVLTTARLLAVADAGWTIATVGVVVAGLLPLAGASLALAVAAVTAGFAVVEHQAATRPTQPAPALAAR